MNKVPKYNPRAVIWSSRLDDRFDVAVFGCSLDRHGVLVIREADAVLLEETVPLSCGALYGPDIADVAAWQKRAAEFVDHLSPD